MTVLHTADELSAFLEGFKLSSEPLPLSNKGYFIDTMLDNDALTGKIHPAADAKSRETMIRPLVFIGNSTSIAVGHYADESRDNLSYGIYSSKSHAFQRVNVDQLASLIFQRCVGELCLHSDEILDTLASKSGVQRLTLTTR